MPDVKEAAVTVNGKKLTEAQSMTLRVALNIFIMEMKQAPLSGMSLALQEGYQRNAEAVNKLIMDGPA